MEHIVDKILNIIREYFQADDVAIIRTGGNVEVFPKDGNEELVEFISSLDAGEFSDAENLSKLFKDKFNTVNLHFIDSGHDCKCILIVNGSKNELQLNDALKDLINCVLCGEEFAESQKLLEIFDNLDLIIYSTSPDSFRFNLISGSVKPIFGYELNNIENKKFTLIKRIYPEDRKKLKTFLQEIRQGKKAVIEYRIKDNYRNERYVRHTGIPVIKENKIISVIGTIIDVTEEIKLREGLRYSEERFRLLIDTASDFIFSLDKTGSFVLVNRNGAMALGYSVKEMLGKHFLEFVNEDYKAQVAVDFQRILSTEEPVNFEARLVDNFGKKMIFDIHARCLKANGKLEGMLGIGRDITKRIEDEKKLKELNSKLIEANRLVSIERDRAKEQITVLEELNRLKNDFISNVSHELRTPLASIVGFAEAIANDPEMPREMINEFNEIIFTEGKRLAKLINDILDLSKLDLEGEGLEKSDFNLLKVLRDVTDNYEKLALEKGLDFSAEIPEAMIMINADKDRITSAIGNVLSNAIKFTDAGGRVSVLVNDFLKEVEIIISDTGIGIPEDDIPKLFEKFTKVNRPGTQVPGAGIGLAATKKIIDLHNGLIRIKSELNKGTTVIIRLPKKV